MSRAYTAFARHVKSPTACSRRGIVSLGAVLSSFGARCNWLPSEPKPNKSSGICTIPSSSCVVLLLFVQTPLCDGHHTTVWFMQQAGS